MLSPTISLCFLMLLLGVFGAADFKVSGIQLVDTNCNLTILCPQYGFWCLFDMPSITSKAIRNIKVQSRCTHESSDFTFVLDWDPEARKAYTHAVRDSGLFGNMEEDGFGSIDFSEDGEEARVETSESEGGWTIVPALDPQKAKELCDQLGCITL